MSLGDPDMRTLRVLGALPFTWGWRGGDGAGDSHCQTHDETAVPLVPACHWDELVLPPCCAGENFAAAVRAHEYKAFKYL